MVIFHSYVSLPEGILLWKDSNLETTRPLSFPRLSLKSLQDPLLDLCNFTSLGFLLAGVETGMSCGPSTPKLTSLSPIAGEVGYWS